MSFMPPFDTFCYTTKPFELKSVGAMYQRSIQKCLHSQHGRNAEVYIDDVFIKTREDEGLLSDLAETFNNLRKFKIKLNPEKCTFDVYLEKLLGYMVSWWRINTNQETVSSITNMEPPKILNDKQKLTGVWLPSAESSHDSASRGTLSSSSSKSKISSNGLKKCGKLSKISRST
jgi:hypothetical protein